MGSSPHRRSCWLSLTVLKVRVDSLGGTLALPGYDIAVEACRGILHRVGTDPGPQTAHTQLSAAVDQVLGTMSSPAIAAALTNLWNDTLHLQCEAAQTRIHNAVSGVGTAVSAYVAGDLEMAEDARRAAVEAPSIELDDVKSF